MRETMKIINQPGENRMKHHLALNGVMLCTGKAPSYPAHWNERPYNSDIERWGSSRWHCLRCAKAIANA